VKAKTDKPFNYKTNFVYTTQKAKETTHIDVELNVDNKFPILEIFADVHLAKEDIEIILKAMQRDISNRMPVNAKECVIFVTGGYSLSALTTFKIGGKAKSLCLVSTEDAISEAIEILKKCGTDYYIIGAGSNLLVSDKGFNGTIIYLGEYFSNIRLEGESTIIAQAGATLKDLTDFTLEKSLTGLEFAEGIPGSVGGSCVMNAGAYGGEMKDVIKEVRAMDSLGNIQVISSEEMDFGYRTSKAMKENLIITEVTFILAKGEKDIIKATIDELRQKREEKQPLDLPSAGSVFKRPEGHFAGKLIMDAGLAGYKVGGAMVSEKHCGFIVNHDNATCEDVLNLIEHIQNTVYKKFGVKLEREVRVLK